MKHLLNLKVNGQIYPVEVGIGLRRVVETHLPAGRGLDRGQQQLEIELQQVDVGDRDRDMTTDHDAGVEHAVDQVTQDEIALLEIVGHLPLTSEK